MTRPLLPAYVAAFRLGARVVAGDRFLVASSLLIYATLLIVFSTIYKIMPVDELGMQGLTWQHLLWYFAMTEGLIVSSPGLAVFGQMIANSELTGMMQRPTRIMGIVIARLAGMHLTLAVFIFAFAALVMPFFFGAALPVPLTVLPFVGVSFVLGVVLFEMMAYALGTVEVTGPYSRSLSWIVGKFIFAFGGLFFPVAFFPEVLQKIVWMTPFPAIIYVPASMMLTPDVASMVEGICIQLFWIAVVGVIAWMSERGMIHYVMERGD